ncbi:HNH endonuclease [Streptomyces melanosporofaciens]
MQKTCNDCGVTKDVSEFTKRSNRKSGYDPYCKPCACERAKKWQRENPEKAKARDSAWYQANKERKKANDQRRLAGYRERRREIDRARYIANGPEYQRERWNRWYQANREHSLRYKQAQRIIRRGQDADWSKFPESLAYVQVIANDPCVYCGAATATIDHIVPVAAGGGGEWSNLAPACMSCNSSKRHTDLLGYLLRTVQGT